MGRNVIPGPSLVKLECGHVLRSSGKFNAKCDVCESLPKGDAEIT